MSAPSLGSDSEFILKMNVTHSVLTDLNLQEIRFDRRVPLSEVKAQLEYRTGTTAQTMNLHLKDNCGAFLVEMANTSESL